jgi:uncharacterized protein YoxC
MSLSDVVAVVLLVLLGVVAGALIPTILQARRTFRVAEVWFEGTGRKVDRLVEDVSQVAARLNRAGVDLEGSVQDAKELLANLREIADSASRLRGAVRTVTTVGSVLGPAIAEGLRAAFAPGREEVHDFEGRPDSTQRVDSPQGGPP